MRKRVLIPSALVALTLVLSACGPKQEQAAEPTPTPTVSVSASATKDFTVTVAKEATAQQGFAKRSIKVNAEVDQKTAKAVDAGTFVFSKNTKITTPALAAGFIATGSPEAKKVESLAINQAKAHGVTVTHAMLINPGNWAAISTGEKVVWTGNTYIVGDTVMGGAVKVDPAGSVVMVFVPPIEAFKVVNGKANVNWVFFMRGACGNPQTSPPKPPNPKPPVPTCKPGVPVPPNGLCPKDPADDPQSQGNVPTQGTKDKPSDDNASEVSQKPQKPSDSGNGIPSGQTPRATPAPSATQTAPPSGSGPTTLPSPTQSPQGTASGAPSPSNPQPSGTPSDF